MTGQCHRSIWLTDRAPPKQADSDSGGTIAASVHKSPILQVTQMWDTVRKPSEEYDI